MKRKLMIGGIIIIVAVLIIGAYNYFPTGEAVLSGSLVIHENVERSIGYDGVIYTVSSVIVSNSDNAIFQITSDQTSTIQIIETRERKYHILDPEIGKARVYVEDINTQKPDGKYIKVRLEPLVQSLKEGIIHGED